MRRIGSVADIKEGLAALTSACPHLASVHALAGDPPLRKRPKGFEGLARVIVGQQLSIASADAIWGRVLASVQPFQPAPLLEVPEKHLRKAGLSRGKIATLRALAQAIDQGALKLDALNQAPEEAIHAELTAVKEASVRGPRTSISCLARPGRCLAARRSCTSTCGQGRALACGAAVSCADERGCGSLASLRGVAARLLWSYYALRRRTNAVASKPRPSPPRRSE